MVSSKMVLSTLLVSSLCSIAVLGSRPTQLGGSKQTVITFFKPSVSDKKKSSFKYTVPLDGVDCVNFEGPWDNAVSGWKIKNEKATKDAALIIYTDANCQGIAITDLEVHKNEASSFSYTTPYTVINFFTETSSKKRKPPVKFTVPEGGFECQNYEDDSLHVEAASISNAAATSNGEFVLTVYTGTDCQNHEVTEFQDVDQAGSFRYYKPQTELNFFKHYRRKRSVYRRFVPDGGIKCEDFPADWNNTISSSTIINAAATEGINSLELYTQEGCNGYKYSTADFPIFYDQASSFSYTVDTTICIPSCEDGSVCEETESGPRCMPDCPCVERYEPVCGRNGNSYPNECVAKCQGTSVLSEGICAPCSPPCPTNADCKQTSSGPQCLYNCKCPLTYVPVCGSDGVTYPNACDATCHGLEFTDGACEYTADYDWGPCPKTYNRVCAIHKDTELEGRPTMYPSACIAELHGADVILEGVRACWDRRKPSIATNSVLTQISKE